MDERYKYTHIYFDEPSHKYTDSLGNNYTSVTTMIHDNYTPRFDKNYWLKKKSKELGITASELEQQWKNITNEACTRGTATHNGIENAIKETSMFKNAIKYLTDIKTGRCVTVADIPYMKTKPLDLNEFKKATNNKYEKIYSVFEFYLNKGYVIYSEIAAFLIDYLISGTIDILCIKDDKFVILDWKTNRNGLQFEAGYFKKDKTLNPVQLTNEYVITNEKMLPPLSHLDNCNGMHYTMQLSTYARMVELILGIPCVGLGLCHIGSPFIKNEYGMPYRDINNLYPIDKNGEETINWYRINYLKKEVDDVLADRRKILNSSNKHNRELKLFENE